MAVTTMAAHVSYTLFELWPWGALLVWVVYQMEQRQTEGVVQLTYLGCGRQQAVGLGGVGVWVAVQGWRWSRVRCGQCGYDLQGVKRERCSECGAAVGGSSG